MKTSFFFFGQAVFHLIFFRRKADSCSFFYNFKIRNCIWYNISLGKILIEGVPSSLAYVRLEKPLLAISRECRNPRLPTKLSQNLFPWACKTWKPMFGEEKAQPTSTTVSLASQWRFSPQLHFFSTETKFLFSLLFWALSPPQFVCQRRRDSELLTRKYQSRPFF